MSVYQMVFLPALFYLSLAWGKMVTVVNVGNVPQVRSPSRWAEEWLKIKAGAWGYPEYPPASGLCLEDRFQAEMEIEFWDFLSGSLKTNQDVNSGAKLVFFLFFIVGRHVASSGKSGVNSDHGNLIGRASFLCFDKTTLVCNEKN